MEGNHDAAAVKSLKLIFRVYNLLSSDWQSVAELREKAVRNKSGIAAGKTLTAHLQTLVAAQLAQRKGTGRGSVYALAEKRRLSSGRKDTKDIISLLLHDFYSLLIRERDGSDDDNAARVRRIRENFGNKFADLAHRVAVVPAPTGLSAPKNNPEVMKSIEEASLLERQLTIEYHPESATEDNHTVNITVEPLGLVLRGDFVVDLVARKINSDCPENFRVHRIRGAKVSRRSLTVYAKKFDLNAQLSAGGRWDAYGKPTVDYILWVDKFMASKLHPRQTPLPGQTPNGYIPVSDGAWIHLHRTKDVYASLFLRTNGGHVVAVEPTEFRNAAIASFKAGLRQYKQKLACPDDIAKKLQKKP